MKKLLCLPILAVVTACATGPSPEELALRAEVARTIPVCRTSTECEVKWGAARNHVINNSGWKLQHYTNDFMETFNAAQHSPLLAWRVQKEAQQDGSYRIVASNWCSNMFGCQPNEWAALKSFNAAVNAAWRPTTP